MNRILLSAILAMGLASAAQANVSTYSGIGGSITGPGTYTEDDITTTSASGQFWGWPSPGQVHLDPSGFAGNTVTITFASGPFDLESFLISFASGGAVLTVTGFDASNNVIATEAVSAGSIGTHTFSGFVGLTSATIVDSVAHASFDDLTVKASAVPEPASLALLGLALAGLGAVRAQAPGLTFHVPPYPGVRRDRPGSGRQRSRGDAGARAVAFHRMRRRPRNSGPSRLRGTRPDSGKAPPANSLHRDGKFAPRVWVTPEFNVAPRILRATILPSRRWRDGTDREARR